MLRVNYEKWNQTPEDIRFMAQEAAHPRTRERLMAVYEVASGPNASRIARQYRRENETVQGWVHLYNERGPQGLVFKRSGGRPPFVRRSKQR